MSNWVQISTRDGFLRQDRILKGFWKGLPSFTEFYLVLPGFAGAVAPLRVWVARNSAWEGRQLVHFCFQPKISEMRPVSHASATSQRSHFLFLVWSHNILAKKKGLPSFIEKKNKWKKNRHQWRYRVSLPRRASVYRVSAKRWEAFYRVLPGFTGFYRVLPSFTGLF